MDTPPLAIDQFDSAPSRLGLLDRLWYARGLVVVLALAQQDFEHAHHNLHKRNYLPDHGRGLDSWLWSASRDPYGTAEVRVKFQLGMREMFSRKATERYMLRAVQAEVLDKLREHDVRFALTSIGTRGQRVYRPATPIQRLTVSPECTRETWPWDPTLSVAQF